MTGCAARCGDIIDKNGYPNIGTDLSLGRAHDLREHPYFVVQFTDSATSALQAIADQDIFLISPLASLAIVPVQLLGDLPYIPTNILAQVVAWLTGVSNTSIFPLLPAPLPAAGRASRPAGCRRRRAAFRATARTAAWRSENSRFYSAVPATKCECAWQW